MRDKYTYSLKKRIKEYGREVLKSKLFKKSFKQKHHLHTTVGKHSLQVALWSLKIADYLSSHGISVDTGLVVRAALLHDLGMIGRDRKYKNNLECSRRHPVESVLAAKRIIGHLSPKMENAILNHMWPLSPNPPSSWEGLAVSLGDKAASIADLISLRYLIYHKLPIPRLLYLKNQTK